MLSRQPSTPMFDPQETLKAHISGSPLKGNLGIFSSRRALEAELEWTFSRPHPPSTATHIVLYAGPRDRDHRAFPKQSSLARSGVLQDGQAGPRLTATPPPLESRGVLHSSMFSAGLVWDRQEEFKDHKSSQDHCSLGQGPRSPG